MLPLLLFALGAAWWAASGEAARERMELARAAAHAANAVEISIRERFTLVRAFARNVERLAADRAAIAAAAREVQAATGIHIIVGTAEGRQIVNTTVPQGVEAGLPPGPGVARRAIARHDAFLTEVFLRPRGIGAVALVAIAARPPGSDPWGVAASVEPAQLAAVLPVPEIPGAFAAVIDGAGRLVAVARTPKGDGDATGPARGGTALPTPLALDTTGMRHASAAVPGTDWSVVVGIPRDASPMPADRALRLILCAGIAGLFIAALLATLLSRTLLRQAQELVSVAGAGIPAPAAHSAGPHIRELRLLRDSLRAARSSFEDRTQQAARLAMMAEVASCLEATVSERTAALEHSIGRLLNAEDDERRRIAREIHDGTAQDLHAAAMMIGVAQARIASSQPAEAIASLADARDSLDHAREELRTLAFLLQPPLLDECGLVMALRVYAEGFACRTGLAVALQAATWPAYTPRAVETVLFRVAQEALGNIHRHAMARHVELHLADADGMAIMTVIDDGRGLRRAEYAAGPVLGVGIPSMRARLRQLGGNLAITSDRRGTRIVAQVPHGGLSKACLQVADRRDCVARPVG
ncbi:MAG: histidine kinase [Paracraurococcus sp.]